MKSVSRQQKIANRIVDQVYNRKVRHAASMDILERVTDFLSESPNPTDDEFHEWAEGEGVNVHGAEECAYVLASMAARFLTGGKANEKGINSTDVDPRQFAMGVKTESEHTPDPFVAARIALDHLAEIPDYYTRLAKMEEDAGIGE